MGQARSRFFFDDGEEWFGLTWTGPDALWEYIQKSGDVFGAEFTARRQRSDLEAEGCKDKHHIAEHVLVNDGNTNFWWHGTACRKCWVFLGPYRPHADLMPVFATREEAERRRADPLPPRDERSFGTQGVFCEHLLEEE